ncbi:hypothetical protein CRENBAI_013295 [Crenichthys baileyi]|uniref:Uncharacterized protein n=1 Tax=Crenichthys baileyi TaxID=28760 RepID=A0AAV9RAR4_9TELE
MQVSPAEGKLSLQYLLQKLRVLGAAYSHTSSKCYQNESVVLSSIKALKQCKFHFLSLKHAYLCFHLGNSFPTRIHNLGRFIPLHCIAFFPPFLLQAGNEHRRFCASPWRGLEPPPFPTTPLDVGR